MGWNHAGSPPDATGAPGYQKRSLPISYSGPALLGEASEGWAAEPCDAAPPSAWEWEKWGVSSSVSEHRHPKSSVLSYA